MFDDYSVKTPKLNLDSGKVDFIEGRIKAGFIQSLKNLPLTESKRILDLSEFSVKKFNSFTEIGFNNIQFTEFYQSSNPSIFKQDGLLDEKMLDDIFFGESHNKSFRKFDVVLCWDILNYLPSLNLKTLTDFLFKHTTNSANLFALVYTKKIVPIKPVEFEIEINKNEFYLSKKFDGKMVELNQQITSKQLHNFFAPWYLNKISLCHGFIHDVHFTK